jgi:hypothetical protein
MFLFDDWGDCPPDCDDEPQAATIAKESTMKFLISTDEILWANLRQWARFAVCGATLFTLTMCHPHGNICQYPAAKRANDIERGSEALQRKLETTNGVMPPHYSCESTPVPASVNVFISNNNNLVQQNVFVDARGLAHGLTPDDCKDTAQMACEEAVDQYFAHSSFSRPQVIRCKSAIVTHCE